MYDGTDDVIQSTLFALKSIMFLKYKNKPNNTIKIGNWNSSKLI